MKITTLNSPATEAAIAACERRIGRPIPTAYRAFLAKHNGGTPQPATFAFVDDAGATASSINEFLSVGADYESIEKYLAVFGTRVSSDLFPIANDPGGNLVLIGTGAENDGRIFFWDHDFEADDGETPDYRNVYPVAESLDAFLAALSDDER